MWGERTSRYIKYIVVLVIMSPHAYGILMLFSLVLLNFLSSTKSGVIVR